MDGAYGEGGKQHGVYFNNSGLEVKKEYVAWVDVMGTRSTMTRSVMASATYIFKLHTAALLSSSEASGVALYPVMDGFYVTCNKQETILKYLENVYAMIAAIFISESEDQHRFLIRGAMSYGAVYHGRDISETAFERTLCKTTDDSAILESYKRCLIVGMPVIQAYLAEPQAPPFGLYVHESARQVDPPKDTCPHVWYQWRGMKNRRTGAGLSPWDSMKDEVDKYFRWCSAKKYSIDWNQDRISEHQRRAEEYFG